MTMWTALAKIAKEQGPDGRQRPRFRASGLVVDHGVVTDFSASGLRISFTKAPKYCEGDSVELTLQSERGSRTCLAEVVWIAKTGRRSADIGFRFPSEQVAEEMQLFKAAFDPLAGGDWSNR